MSNPATPPSGPRRTAGAWTEPTSTARRPFPLSSGSVGRSCPPPAPAAESRDRRDEVLYVSLDLSKSRAELCDTTCCREYTGTGQIHQLPGRRLAAPGFQRHLGCGELASVPAVSWDPPLERAAEELAPGHRRFLRWPGRADATLAKPAHWPSDLAARARRTHCAPHRRILRCQGVHGIACGFRWPRPHTVGRRHVRTRRALWCPPALRAAVTSSQGCGWTRGGTHAWDNPVGFTEETARATEAPWVPTAATG
jgi:hypothetical protein